MEFIADSTEQIYVRPAKDVPLDMLRELALPVVYVPPSNDVRARVADSVARLDRWHESEALRWTEAISEFDESEAR